MTYKQVAAGGIHAAALRSDGTVHVFGVLEMPGTRGAMLLRHCDVPMLEAGVTYEQVSLGDTHTVYLRSDGIAVATGFPPDHSQCDIPPLSEGATYTQVSAGSSHTVLLRSDGTVVCCGENGVGQCDVPAPEEGVTYTQVSAGASFTVLLRSDGEAIAFGANDLGQCDVARRPRGDDALEARRHHRAEQVGGRRLRRAAFRRGRRCDRTLGFVPWHGRRVAGVLASFGAGRCRDLVRSEGVAAWCPNAPPRFA